MKVRINALRAVSATCGGEVRHPVSHEPSAARRGVRLHECNQRGNDHIDVGA